LIELRRLYSALGWPEPTQAFVDMHDLGDMLVECGYSDPVMDQEVITLTWPSGAAMLDELRTLGGNTSPHRAQGCRTPAWRARLANTIDNEASREGRVAMGFEVVYGHAFKVRSRPTFAPEVKLPLGDMRAMLKGGRKPR
jgi:malonyl-CoA O-methyltransferase